MSGGFVHGVDHSLSHPNVFTASLEWAEAQKLHVACAYSNPIRWNTRRSLFNDFRRHMASCPNVALHVGELAYGDRPHEVTHPDHPLDHQYRTRHELWHKENLLNRIVQQFPSDWKYGAYVDGDLVFSRHDWALEAVHLLQHYDWVQLFSSIADLGSHHEVVGTRPSFMHNYLGGEPQAGAYYDVPPRSRREGGPGGAWAFRREAFDACGGFLDVCILGAGDSHMALGLVGKDSSRHHEAKDCGDTYRNSILAWQNRARCLKWNVGCVNCHVLHHWHGPKAKRGYESRWKILKANRYDPTVDLFRDSQGIYQLNPDKPDLRDDIRDYFRSRREDHHSFQ